MNRAVVLALFVLVAVLLAGLAIRKARYPDKSELVDVCLRNTNYQRILCRCRVAVWQTGTTVRLVHPDGRVENYPLTFAQVVPTDPDCVPWGPVVEPEEE
ncbi:hypothetical protein [Oceanithermus sp.]|uniref:hypothetical protein n=1 Tax=Oceanithermus sp. TaxID=2268145 RepID=UPI0025E4A942|nr:hypothetical protein [Oceanithermus sp.]